MAAAVGGLLSRRQWIRNRSQPESRHCRFLKPHARVFHFSQVFEQKPSPAHFGRHFVGREGIPRWYSALAEICRAGERFSHGKRVSWQLSKHSKHYKLIVVTFHKSPRQPLSTCGVVFSLTVSVPATLFPNHSAFEWEWSTLCSFELAFQQSWVSYKNMFACFAQISHVSALIGDRRQWVNRRSKLIWPSNQTLWSVTNRPTTAAKPPVVPVLPGFNFAFWTFTNVAWVEGFLRAAGNRIFSPNKSISSSKRGYSRFKKSTVLQTLNVRVFRWKTLSTLILGVIWRYQGFLESKTPYPFRIWPLTTGGGVRHVLGK